MKCHRCLSTSHTVRDCSRKIGTTCSHCNQEHDYKSCLSYRKSYEVAFARKAKIYCDIFNIATKPIPTFSSYPAVSPSITYKDIVSGPSPVPEVLETLTSTLQVVVRILAKLCAKTNMLDELSSLSSEISSLNVPSITNHAASVTTQHYPLPVSADAHDMNSAAKRKKVSPIITSPPTATVRCSCKRLLTVRNGWQNHFKSCNGPVTCCSLSVTRSSTPSQLKIFNHHVVSSHTSSSSNES